MLTQGQHPSAEITPDANVHALRMSPTLSDATPTLTHSENALAEDVIETLATRDALLVLAQDGTNERLFVKGMLARSRARYGKAHVLHLELSFDASKDINEYFRLFGRQCQFENSVREPLDWENALRKRLAQAGPIFLLVSGMEYAPHAVRQELAGMLRVLHEELPRMLHVVLCGGERLAALKYELGELSLLNHAEVLDWPEFTATDVLTIQRRSFPAVALDTKEMGVVLSLCGGHPLLLECCLMARERRESMREEDIRQLLRNYGFLWHSFIPFRAIPGASERICAWLQHEERLGKYMDWEADPLLRRLYWNNLIMNHEGRYRWRCEVIREVGREVLSCESL